MSETQIVQVIDTTASKYRRWIYILVGVIVAVLLVAGIVTKHHAKKAQAAIQQAAVLKSQKEEAVKQGEKASAEASTLRKAGDEKVQAAQEASKTIASLKATVAKLKAQRPASEQPSQVETAQDSVIGALDEKVATLEGATKDYKGALDAKDRACESYKVALDASDKRAAAFKTALDLTPRAYTWSVVPIIGKGTSGATKIGATFSYSVGHLRAEGVVLQDFAGGGIGLNW